MSLRDSINLTDLQTSLQTLNVASLKSMCSKLGILAEGRKVHLIKRLIKRLASKVYNPKFAENLTVRTEEAELNYQVDGKVIEKHIDSDDWKVEFLPKRVGGYDWVFYLLRKDGSEDLSLYIKALDADTEVLAVFEYTFEKIDNCSGLVVAHNSGRFKGPSKFEDSGWGFPKFIRIEDLSADLHNCRFEFHCKLLVYGENEHTVHAQFEPRFMHLGKAIRDIAESDFHIVLQDESTIPVHRIVLEVASPVMKAMLCHGVRENIDDRMTIEDFEPSVVRMFISSLYDGTVSEECDFKQIFAIADKYKVGPLAEKCLLELSKRVTIENACFILGSMKRCNYYQGTPHEERVSKFIDDNFHEIESTDDFQAVSKDPVLLLSILRQRGRGKKRKREDT